MMNRPDPPPDAASESRPRVLALLRKRFAPEARATMWCLVMTAVDATNAWILWRLVSARPVSWAEWWVICFAGTAVVRSAMFSSRGQNTPESAADP